MTPLDLDNDTAALREPVVVRRGSLMRNIPVALLLLATVGCMDDPFVTLPDDTNAVRHRSVIIDASTCRHKDGSLKACNNIAAKDMRRVAEMRGVIGAPSKAVALDSDSYLKEKSYNLLSAFWSRIPVGYGCDATMQGIFPDASKDPANILNYNLAPLDELIGAVSMAYRVPIWTAAYGLGDGKGAQGKSTCTYGDAGLSIGGKTVKEQFGTPIGNSDAEIADWAKAVRRVTKWYNRDLPAKVKDDIVCNPPAGQAKAWQCTPSLFNIEFGRDPNGAGGFTKATKGTWLKSYNAFAKELRAEFPYPGNDVLLIGPSVVIKSATEAANTDPSSEQRSWLYDFVDYVVANKLPLSMLSFEVEAASPVEARDIAKYVREYADKKGLKDEDGNPIRLFVTDLRLNDAKVPATLLDDDVRYSAYQGAFFAATKTLWQGYVYGATIGRVVRFPTEDTAAVSEVDLAKTAVESELLWFEHPTAIAGALKPGAWHAFWFNRDFVGSGGGKLDACKPNEVCTDIAAEARAKGMVLVEYGPDAVGTSGTVEVNESRGLIALATRENCVSSDPDQLGQAVDCVGAEAGGATFPVVTSGRQRVLRVLVSDLHVTVPSAKEVLMHDLRVQVKGLPKDVKTVGYRWARMDGTATTWTGFKFPEQGVLDVHDGQFHIQRMVGVPSVHYFELLY